MKRRNGTSWFRGAKTLASGFFRKHGQMGAQAPMSSFLMCVGLVAVVFFAILSYMWWWFPYHLFSDEVYNIVVVNAPQSFIDFNQYMQKERDEVSEDFGSRTDWIGNFDNIASFEYTYDGYGSTVFIYKENPALYDFVTFGKWMRENDAYLTVVFPEDFDKKVSERTKDTSLEKPDILTYYRTNSLEYTSMKRDFIDEYLTNYQYFMRDNNDWFYTSISDSQIRDDPMDLSGRGNDRNFVFDILGRTFVPLLIFIVILYAAMSAGTNVIAGQKERGTFTGILMTPVPRSAIIAGNLAGVALKTLIPAFVVTAPLFLIPYYRTYSNIGAIVIHVLLLTVFTASITILISVINDTVVSAQTAFLPVFLILVSACVTCIQNSMEREEFYLYLPVYGQFYGIGDALSGNANYASVAIASLTTLVLAVIVVLISERLLHNERYTVSIDPITAKEIRQARSGKHSALEIADKITDNVMFFFREILYPLAVIGVFQMIAVIPVAITYMRKAEYSQYIASLKDVAEASQLFSKTFEIITIFMGNPLFLALMAVAYTLMIIACVLRAKRLFKKDSLAGACEICGLPVSSRGRIAREYLTGLLSGFLMMSGVCLILKFSGQIEFTGFGLEKSAVPVFLINLIMWLPQGASEEVLFRGYLIPRIETRYKRAFAVFFSSLLFSVFHSLNMGYTPLASVNLFLIAILFALIYIKTGSIWMTSAMHTIWNLSQGNIYGLQVSGTEAHAALIKTVYTEGSKDIITGGAFGPEGGLAVTAITAVCIVIVIISIARTRNLTRNKNA